VNYAQQQRLIGLSTQPIQWQCNLHRYTSFAIGGPAEAVVKVELTRELQPLLFFLTEENIPWRVLGKGTNLLVRDEGFPGVIVLLGGEFEAIGEEEGVDGAVLLRVGAGCGLAKLSRRCSEHGLTGLEFGCGIPGTIGGAVIMNAGAWGRDIASVLQSVTLVTATKEIILPRRELVFSYRCWNDFSPYQGHAVVAAVTLELRRGDVETIMTTCKTLLELRKSTQPSEYASAGSFFKNPPHDSAGRLIEASGLKGLTVGGAMVSERHGNFLVNTGGATADDVLCLMKIIQEKIKDDFGIDLEPEVHLI
jgi:UDP-N-acetylmuramate dehydrogenase